MPADWSNPPATGRISRRLAQRPDRRVCRCRPGNSTRFPGDKSHGLRVIGNGPRTCRGVNVTHQLTIHRVEQLMKDAPTLALAAQLAPINWSTRAWSHTTTISTRRRKNCQHARFLPHTDRLVGTAVRPQRDLDTAHRRHRPLIHQRQSWLTTLVDRWCGRADTAPRTRAAELAATPADGRGFHQSRRIEQVGRCSASRRSGIGQRRGGRCASPGLQHRRHLVSP